MKYFYKDFEIEVPETVYMPREDSELLAEVMEKMELKGKRCLDMGCGSGLLAIVMASKGATVTATDINIEAVFCTKENAARNNVNVTAINSDLFENIKGKFDLMVFNAPYLPEDTKLEMVSKRRNGPAEKLKEVNIMRQWGGGPSGREVINNFLEQAKNFLEKDGRILMLISSVTGEKEVAEIAMANDFDSRIIARKKIPWEELIVIEMCVKQT